MQSFFPFALLLKVFIFNSIFFLVMLVIFQILQKVIQISILNLLVNY